MRGVPRGLVDNKYNTFQPRVGFSYDFFGDAKTVFAAASAPSTNAPRATTFTVAAIQHALCLQPEHQQYLFQLPRNELADWRERGCTGIPDLCHRLITLAPHNYTPPAVAMYSLGAAASAPAPMVWVGSVRGQRGMAPVGQSHINNIPRTVGNVTVPSRTELLRQCPSPAWPATQATTRRSAMILRASRDSSPSRVD